MANVIGEQPRPWLLVVGFSLETGLGLELTSLFPTVVAVSDLSEVRQLDYDAAVVVGTSDHRFLDSHLQVVWFSDDGAAPAHRARAVGEPFASSHYHSEARWQDGERASRFVVSQFAREEGLGALSEALAPTSASSYRVIADDGWLEDQRHPLLTEMGGREGACAAVYYRGHSKASEVWCLPNRALQDGKIWVQRALARWQRTHPERFPVADWEADPAWMTKAELDTRSQLESHDEDTAQLVEVRSTQRRELDQAAETAKANADSGLRLLLTSNGSPLVGAVMEALTSLGFQVIDADEEIHEPGQKREDLLVEDQGWVAVTEVKGYARGNAKANDLLQLSSSVESYVLRTQQRPSARWYVVNQSFQTPPDMRAEPFASAGDTVEKFEQNSGLVIDTRDLFRLVRAAQAESVELPEARRRLREAVGVFRYPKAIGGAGPEPTGPVEALVPNDGQEA